MESLKQRNRVLLISKFIVFILFLGTVPRLEATTDEAAYGTYSGIGSGHSLTFRYTNRGIERLRVDGTLITSKVIDVSEEGRSDSIGRYSFEFRSASGTGKVCFMLLFDDEDHVRAAAAIYWIEKTTSNGFSILNPAAFALSFKKQGAGSMKGDVK